MTVFRLYKRLGTFIKEEYDEADSVNCALITFAFIAPIVVSQFLNWPMLGIYGGLTAQLIMAAKVRGSYARRSLILLVSILTVAIATFTGTLEGENIWTATIFIAIFGFFSGLLRGLGDYGVTVGITVILLFLLSLRSPFTMEAALERSLMVILGGLWAFFLAVIPWPVLPYRPYYEAISKPWAIVANIAALLSQEEREKIEERLHKKETDLRKTLNDSISYLKGGDSASSPIRREFIKMLRSASRLGITVISIRTELDKIAHEGKYDFIVPTIRHILASISKTAKALTDVIGSYSTNHMEALLLQFVRVQSLTLTLDKRLQNAEIDFEIKAELRKFVDLFEASHRYIEDTISLLQRFTKKRKAQSFYTLIQTSFHFKQRFRQMLIEFRFRSLLFRHSLRLMLTLAVGTAIYYLSGIEKWYWIPLTIVVVLQPEFGATTLKSGQRMLGTIIGGLLATLLIYDQSSLIILDAIIAFSSFFFFYFMQRNYAVAVVFLTIELVAFLELYYSSIWTTAGQRVMATLIGGALSVAASYLFWPKWENIDLPTRMGRLIRTNKNYLLKIGYGLKKRSEKTGNYTTLETSLISIYRKIETKNIEMTEVMKRIKMEPGCSRRLNLKTFEDLAYQNIKLTRDLTFFSTTSLTHIVARFSLHDSINFIGQCAVVLENLAAAVEQRRNYTEGFNFINFLIDLERKIKILKESVQDDAAAEEDKKQEVFILKTVKSHLDTISTDISAMCLIAENLEVSKKKKNKFS